jgi:hypothetical protein
MGMLVDQCCDIFCVLLRDDACHVSFFMIHGTQLELIVVRQGHPPTSLAEVYDNRLASSCGDSCCRIFCWRRARASDPGLFPIVCIANGDILRVHGRNRFYPVLHAIHNIRPSADCIRSPRGCISSVRFSSPRSVWTSSILALKAGVRFQLAITS